MREGESHATTTEKAEQKWGSRQKPAAEKAESKKSKEKSEEKPTIQEKKDSVKKSPERVAKDTGNSRAAGRESTSKKSAQPAELVKPKYDFFANKDKNDNEPPVAPAQDAVPSLPAHNPE